MSLPSPPALREPSPEAGRGRGHENRPMGEGWGVASMSRNGWRHWQADMPFAKANGLLQTQPRARPSELRPIPRALKGHPHARPDAAYPSRCRLARPFRANPATVSFPRALPSAWFGRALQAPRFTVPMRVLVPQSPASHEPGHEAGGRGGHEADMPFAKANGLLQTQPRATPSEPRPIPCALKGHPHAWPDAYPSRCRWDRPFRANAASVSFPRALPSAWFGRALQAPRFMVSTRVQIFGKRSFP